jgi:hypothetical protein
MEGYQILLGLNGKQEDHLEGGLEVTVEVDV